MCNNFRPTPDIGTTARSAARHPTRFDMTARSAVRFLQWDMTPSATRTPSDNKSALIDMTIKPYLIIDSRYISYGYSYRTLLPVQYRDKLWHVTGSDEKRKFRHRKRRKNFITVTFTVKKLSRSPQKYFITVTVKKTFSSIFERK